VLDASDIAIGVAHRDQADLVRAALARTGRPNAPRVAVDTANRLQGRELRLSSSCTRCPVAETPPRSTWRPGGCVCSPPATGKHASSSPREGIPCVDVVGEAQARMFFSDEAAARPFPRAAAALRDLGIEVLAADLPEQVRADILDVQRCQYRRFTSAGRMRLA